MRKKTAMIGLALAVAALLLPGCVSAEKRKAAEREKDPQYQYEKAVVCMQYGMVDEALKYLRAALLLDSRHALALNLQGLAFMMKGLVPESIKSFEASVSIDPGFSEGHNNLGTALQEANRLDEAAAAYEKAYALDQNYNAAYNLAKIAYLQERPGQALDWVQKSIARFGRSVLAFNLQGLVFEALERFDEAAASYQQALRIQPAELNVQFNLGVVYYKKKNYSLAKDIFTKVLDELVRNPKAGSDELRGRVQDALKKLEGR
ncbi:MAG: tetratricopeptide repeat protein [Candidatus Aminicenantes bacterium]|nr:tetratricopeptide repeat protein [Candidatus Aminicenantes bacterium]